MVKNMPNATYEVFKRIEIESGKIETSFRTCFTRNRTVTQSVGLSLSKTDRDLILMPASITSSEIE